MVSKSSLNERYTDMANEVRQNNALAKKQLKATQAGLALNAAGIAIAHRDALISRKMQGAILSKQEEQLLQGERFHNELTTQLDSLSASMTEMKLEIRQDLGDLKNIGFAQWRDGVGRKYYYNYRPVAIDFLNRYSQACASWTDIVVKRIESVASSFSDWKEPSWRDDALVTGIFVNRAPYPQRPEFEGFSERPVPQPHSSIFYILIGCCLFFASLMFSAVASMFIVAVTSDKASQSTFINYTVFLSIGITAGVLFTIKWRRDRLIKSARAFNESAQKEASLRNWQNRTNYESRLRDIEIDFLTRNDKARKEAERRFESLVGIEIDQNLAEAWVEPFMRARVRQIRALVENERVNPPSDDMLIDIPKVEPVLSLPADMRAELLTRL